MKRIGLLLIPFLLLLAACSTGTATVIEPGGDEGPASEPTSTSPMMTAEPEPDGVSALSEDPAIPRESDWKKNDVEDPVVTIIEYADFQCPGCAAFAPLIKQIAESYPDDVQVIYRHFPLNSIHPNAQKSAEAAEAAGAQGQFWAYHDLLFDRQRDWSSLDQAAAREFFIDLAAELGLDVDKFTTELDEGLYASIVSQSEQEAVSLGLPGTPAAIVNGQPIPGEGLPRDFESWDSFIKDEINLKNLSVRQYSSPPEMTIDSNKKYLAKIEMASGDTFTIELLPKSAPQTVNSFVFLSREGYFDGVTFHRVLPGFVAQTGDPSGTGRGGPGYLLPNEIDPALSHDKKGVVAMANAGPNTNGSQWYITYGDVSQLDGSYTIFGQVIDGMDIVEKISPRDPSRAPNLPPGDKINSITIEEVNP